MHSFVRFLGYFLVPILSFGLSAARAADLPDTGQNTCDTGFNINRMAPCTAGNSGDKAYYPGQDGRYGSDAKKAVGTLVKKGAGAAGFDYTKLDYDGKELPATAVQGDLVANWACTRDNITGLTWEIKTPGYLLYQLHYAGDIFYWYNGDPNANGGNWGCPGYTCDVPPVATICHHSGGCNTGNFAAAVNNASMATCGQRDWRVPTRRELLTIVHAGSTSGGVDTDYFPNMSGEYWTDTSSAVTNPGDAWTVSLTNGATSFRPKNWRYPVMLVHGTPF